MSKGCFILDMITPRRMLSCEVCALRLVDGTGSFGIRYGHCDFLTVLVPALGSYVDAGGQEHFLAMDGGAFRFQGNRATLISGEIFEDDDPRRLAVTIRDDFIHRDTAEQRIARMVAGIESTFLEKMATMSKEEAR